MLPCARGCLEDHRWRIPVVSLGWTLPAQFSSVSSHEIRGPFSKPKCSVSLMKQYFVCIATLFLGLCCKAAGSGADGVTQVATYLGEVKKAGHFSILVQNRTAGGNLTWLESYVRTKTLTQSRKSGVFVSPGIKKTSLVKWRNASPSRSGGGLPVATPACISGLEMPLGSKRQQE